MRRATYRVQLRAEFDLDRAAGVADYLAELGISDLYCSPLLQAAAGSTHGYDVVDHSRLSADLGGDAAFARLVDRLRARSLGLTVDIVPNHMAIDGRSNRWWWDVLENGPSSLYAPYFDIDWPGDSSRHEQTVLVPVLGDRYGRILDAGEVVVRREGGSFSVAYHDHELPLSPRTQDELLGRAADRAGSPALRDLAADFGALPHAAMTDPTAVRLRHDQKEVLRERLAALCQAEPSVADAVDREVSRLNSDPDEMDRLLCRQNYRLAYWRTAREELDYRRFFNIETLVGLRVEDDRVFADTHECIGRLARDHLVSGLRVDHVDGLRDPDGYLQRLRRLAPAAYVVVEKILEPAEHLPDSWPVDGTTGYDFVTRVANVFVDPAGEGPMTGTYTAVTGEPGDYAAVVRQAKRQIMTDELAPEVDRLTRQLHAVCDGHRRQRDRTRGEVHQALEAVLTSFPVYRTYFQPDRPSRDADVDHVRRAVAAARELEPDTDPDLLEFIGELLMLHHPGGPETEFAQMFPQVSAPVMAKGAEDTAFYRYNRLVSLNEVGGDPGVFGRPLARFHADSTDAARRHPHAMLTLATHDTKRSPDVRARIGLLSELAEPWDEAVRHWVELTDGHAGEHGPDMNARYLLFQTLVGTWPIGTDRLVAYMDKAAKEAKVHTAWADGDAGYERDLRRFTEATVSDGRFVEAFERFMREHRVVETARATSLSMTALLLTCPGVPDIYQGTESWDNSLVDPDNRRPVAFEDLAAGLADVRPWGPDALATGPDRAASPRAKLWLTARLLQHRRARPEPYSGDGYRELPVTGSRADHLIAFDRGGLVVLAGRHLAGLGGDWGDTEVELPGGRWRAVIGLPGEPLRGGPHPVAGLLGRGPVAVLET
ncbi:MAG TPA: malto-oligosyltrehalose synthase [Acidimicrobiales bacterium]|nr:malto-oligosyltrehalose synthase [Acidimicrobiales bacterium]